MNRIYTLLSLFILLSAATCAQEQPAGDNPPLRHEWTPEEWSRRHLIGRGFVETDPPAGPVRNVAEFDRMQGALVRYPFGIPLSLIKEMAKDVTVTTIVANATQQNTVLNQYISNGVDTSHCNFLIAPTDSYWTRDYGPWFESDSARQIGIVDFPYNRPRPNDDEIPKKFAEMLGIPWFGMNVISTGGDYMTDGFGNSASTDLVWVENPTLTAAQIDERMEDYLGITNFQVVPDPNTQSSIDHIDCWGKFLAPDKILIRQTLPTDPEYTPLENAAAYWASQICAYGYPYRVFRVKTPQDQPYTNSVILNDKVLVPIMNSPWDDSAKAVYAAAMPGYQVFGFLGNPGTPWLSTDALHCRVMGVSDIGLLQIVHRPLFGNHPAEEDYAILAEIIASSHQPVLADSVWIHYRVNGGPWLTAGMANTTGDNYSGVIPRQSGGSTVNYYLTAADASGRHANAPFTGSADPFTFETIYTNLTPVPDTLWFTTIDDVMTGKITQLHNYLADPVSLNVVQMWGNTYPWYVDSISSAVPVAVAAGDSVAVRVRMALPVNQAVVYVTDSMRVTTDSGAFHVVIMINQDLLGKVAELQRSAVLSVHPNPFRTETTLSFEPENRGKVLLEIYDGRGIRVRTLVSETREPGKHSVVWSGAGDNGKLLPAGIYLCRMVTEDRTETTRLLKIN